MNSTGEPMRKTERQSLSEIGRLPPLSSVAGELIDLTNGDRANVSAVVDLLSRDPILVSRVLQLSNSPFYGLPGKIDSIKMACMVLGMPTLRNLVVSIAAVKSMPADSLHNIRHQEFWVHSVSVAYVAKEISTQLKLDADTAFTAGMLHDIGKLAMDILYPKEYRQVVRMLGETECTVLKAELEVLGKNHVELGEQLMQSWRLPDNLVQVVRGHHEPKNAGSYKKLATVIYVADMLCHKCVEQKSMDNLQECEGYQYLLRLGIAEDWVLDFITQLASKKREAGDFVAKLAA